MPTVLLLHGLEQVVKHVRRSVEHARVELVPDLVSAKLRVADGDVAAVVLEHPFMGMEAPLAASVLGAAGGRFRVIVDAMGYGFSELEAIRRAIPDADVYGLGDPEDLVRAIGRALSTPPPHDDDLNAVIQVMDDEPIALRPDDASFGRWGALDLPPRLIALLDGTRSAREVVASFGPQAGGVLRALLDAKCLDRGERAVPLTPAACWIPEAPVAPPADEAVLEEVALAEMLLTLRRREETGIAIVQSPLWSIRLELAHGSPVRASGGPEETALGHVLMALGHLSSEAHVRLVAEHQRLRRTQPTLTLGDLAIQVGAVSAEHVRDGLAAQVEGKVHALAPLHEGTCRFWRDEDAARWEGIAPKPVESMLLEGLRQSGERGAALVRAFMERHVHQTARALPRAADILSRFHFPVRVQRLLRWLDGRPVQDAIVESRLVPEEAALALYLLWAAGAVDMAEPS